MFKIMNEDDLELNEQTMKEVKRSREEFKKGKCYTMEEIKKEMK